ncbi:cytochrome b562 [Oleiharenicola lentus]|uniref:cytochrome b562 n=1 Tax=Oleiharenicola lentus TaxID=2508720 RepID=UPI003F67AF09
MTAPRLRSIFILVLSCAIAATGFSQPAPREPETELARAMSTINSSWRKVRRQITDPASNASTLELIARVKTAAEKSTELAPDKAKDLPEADRAKYIEGYQKQMKAFVAELDKLTAALQANDNAGAQEIVKKIGTLEREGHKEYRRKDN